MSAILVGSDLVHYEALGHGRPVIFLHSWVGSWRYWIPAMQTTSSLFRTYAIDLWGFGDSARAVEHYSLNHQVALLNWFLNAMGIERTALICHGLGAVVGLLFASWFPEHVDRMMAVGLPLIEAMINPRLDAIDAEELAEWLLKPITNDDSAIRDIAQADPRAIHLSLTNLRTLDFGTMISTLSTTCLLVHSRGDPVIELPNTDLLTNLPYQMHQIIFEQSGHFPMLDEGSRFNRLLADFLALLPGESPRDLMLKEEWKRRVR